MKRRIHYCLLAIPILAFLVGCSRDVYDEYYGRPDYLEDPIYQQLEAKGNFTNFTKLIEKAGYKDILSKSGYWTMLAPTDEAFTNYFQTSGVSDVSKIDDVTAAKIVRYALIYNAFREEQMSDYQSAIGWEIDNAFRRRTAYYDGFVTKNINGKQIVTVASNRNGGYLAGDNNNKYITYFTEAYNLAKSLSEYDFHYFYPNATYSGFNIMDSKVVEADIIAENGIIHEVDKVNLPPVSLDQYLEQGADYSLFREVLEKNLVVYSFVQSATTAYHNFSGKSDDVYVKFYDPTLAFSPNNENYLKQADNDGQSDMYTMIVPDNTAFAKFRDEVLLKHYSSLDVLPRYIFQDLVNAHMVENTVWPSKAVTAVNALNEDLRFDFNSDIKEAKILSNGIFYGSSKVQASNLFYSVYTSAYLDPRFTLATRMFNDGTGFKELISNIKTRWTLFLPSDEVLLKLGFNYNTNRSEWMYTNPATGVADAANIAKSRLSRVLYNGIVLTPKGELDNLSGSGIIRTGEMDLPGEYIKWKNNKMYAAGNESNGDAVNILSYEDQQNGRTYFVDNVLNFTEEGVGLKIKRLAEASGSQYATFFNYLKNSPMYDAATGKIQGVELGVSYTFMIPNNAAMAQAIKDGVIPASNNPTLEGERDLIKDFIRFHILNGKTASDDGLTVGQFETLRKSSADDKTYVQVESTPGTLIFKDLQYRSANFVKAQSNNLADRSLIHLIDNYLLYAE
ncbi:fasciclin domain-containing protein [Flavobacterium agrisoli]|uniref:Fasciclin domain-containing protein n=1 Tax=Flavobacterium agrisoli TaxID=2793066 RepID=A0A934PNC8_9FLAO|nr:fasciclin domain-containing protein [Flavobacterium agrisoli]MBK0370702.1 fasciclin domain-containing protein [Flavobacterium agrisoli]